MPIQTEVFTCDVGDVVRLRSWDTANPDGFTTTDGTPTDPSTVTLYLELPDGSVLTEVYGTDEEIEREGEGKFFRLYQPTMGGYHYFAFLGAGAVASRKDGKFWVNYPRPAVPA